MQQFIFPWVILRKQAISCVEFTANLAFIRRKRELSVVMREAHRYCTNRVIHLNIYWGIIFSNSLFFKTAGQWFSFLLSFFLFFPLSFCQGNLDTSNWQKLSLNSKLSLRKALSCCLPFLSLHLCFSRTSFTLKPQKSLFTKFPVQSQQATVSSEQIRQFLTLWLSSLANI